MISRGAGFILSHFTEIALRGAAAAQSNPSALAIGCVNLVPRLKK